MYNYAFYAYLFYRGIKASSSIENALGFMSFIKSITSLFSGLKKLTNRSNSELENSELGWVLIFIEGEKLEI